MHSAVLYNVLYTVIVIPVFRHNYFLKQISVYMKVIGRAAFSPGSRWLFAPCRNNLVMTLSKLNDVVNCSSKFNRSMHVNVHEKCIVQLNPLTAKLFNLNFHPLEVVSRWRDPQLQVSENYSDLTKWRSTVFKYCWLMSSFIFNMFKRWYIMC